MAKFEFSKKVITLEFPNVKFDVEYTDDVAAKFRNAGDALTKIAPEVETNPALGIAEIKKCIDIMCGAGACDKIMQDRAVNIWDYIDVYAYIIREFNQFFADMTKKYTANINLKTGK